MKLKGQFKKHYGTKIYKMRFIIIFCFSCLTSSINSQNFENVVIDTEQMKCTVSQSESYYIGKTKYITTTIEYAARNIDFYLIITPLIRFYPDQYAEIKQNGGTLSLLDLLYNPEEYNLDKNYPQAPNLLYLLWKGVNHGDVFKLTILHEASLDVERILAPLRPHKGIGPKSRLAKSYEYKGSDLTIFLPPNLTEYF